MEIINRQIRRGGFRFVLFDFDGTLSLIREGWPQVMIPMMVEILQQTPTRESPAQLHALVEDFVMRLNGKQTIYQMMQLAEEVKLRGGQPLQPLEYKHMYHERLMQRIRSRLEKLESGAATPEQWTVPGSHALLDSLRQRGMQLYLASGTDLHFVQKEAHLLGLTPFFGQHVYGALDEFKNFSKQMVIERILRENQIRGEELIAFGDGFVEIEEVKRVGGVAVAVASDEVNRRGINEWKRQRLIRAGADLVIGDYREQEELLAYLFNITCIMKTNRTDPTPEMIAFYERRTHEHIERVRRCLLLLAEVTDYGEELIERAKVHDASKFGPQERIPYIWLTEYHRCRRNGESFEYPEGIAEKVKKAIHHHVTTNRHHPEFHADPNDMSDVDLIEMVCDWTAMAQEFGQDGGSARGWADKTIGHRVAFNEDKRQFIYEMIDKLDQQIAANP